MGVWFWGGSGPGGCLFPGGFLLRGVLVLGGACSGGGGIPACTEADPPCGQTDTCKNITFATSLQTVTNLCLSRKTHFSDEGRQPQKVKKMDKGRGAHPKLYYVDPRLTSKTLTIKYIYMH